MAVEVSWWMRALGLVCGVLAAGYASVGSAQDDADAGVDEVVPLAAAETASQPVAALNDPVEITVVGTRLAKTAGAAHVVRS